MISNNINQSLGQIHDSLKNLDSAREQVEQVTKNGKELATATHRLALDVKKMADVIGNETSKVIVEFSKGINELNDKIDSSIVNGQESITEEVKSLKNASKQINELSSNNINETHVVTLDFLKKQNKEVTIAVDRIVDTFSSKLIELEKNITSLTSRSQSVISDEVLRFNQEVKNIENNSKSVVEEVRNLSVSTMKQQASSLSSSLEIISVYSKNIQNLFEEMSAMDLSSLHIKLDGLKNDLNVSNEKFNQEINELESSLVGKYTEVTNFINNNLRRTFDLVKEINQRIIDAQIRSADKYDILIKRHENNSSTVNKNFQNVLLKMSSLEEKIIDNEKESQKRFDALVTNQKKSNVIIGILLFLLVSLVMVLAFNL